MIDFKFSFSFSIIISELMVMIFYFKFFCQRNITSKTVKRINQFSLFCIKINIAYNDEKL